MFCSDFMKLALKGTISFITQKGPNGKMNKSFYFSPTVSIVVAFLKA